MEVNVENKVKQASCYLCIQNIYRFVFFKEFRGIDHQNKDVGLIIICLLSILATRQADVEQQYMLNASCNVYFSMTCSGIIIYTETCKKEYL